MNLEKLISELFNTVSEDPLLWNWEEDKGGYEAFFRVGEREYGILVTEFWDLHWTEEDLDFQEIQEITDWEPFYEGTWNLEFYELVGDKAEHGITGSSLAEAPKIFGIVGNGVKELIAEAPREFRNIYFSGKEPSRLKLYARLAPLLARQLNKRLLVNKRQNAFFLIDPSIKLSKK